MLLMRSWCTAVPTGCNLCKRQWWQQQHHYHQGSPVPSVDNWFSLHSAEREKSNFLLVLKIAPATYAQSWSRMGSVVSPAAVCGGNIAAVIIFTHADNLLFILSASNGSLCSLLSNLMISLSVSPNTLDKLQRINFRTKMQFLYE